MTPALTSRTVNAAALAPMLHEIQVILGLLIAMSVIAWAAHQMRMAYPILLIITGLIIGGLGASDTITWLPRVQLSPDVVFVVFLPPILYYAGLLTSWRDFRANIREISLLAIGLVLFTTVIVAVAARAVLPGIPWPAAFALGAIVSPPDAVAATAVMQRMRIPRRIVAILEGESLVNDATALVAYRFAIAAVGMTATFSLPKAAGQFALVAVGGVAIGLAIGALAAWVRPRIKEPTIEGVASILTPYVAYMPAEWLHVSGVLAAVTAGIYMSRKVPLIVSPQSRMRSYAVWDTLIFLINGLVFTLIGLQLPEVVQNLGHIPPWELIWYGTAISVVAIIVRVVWVFPATYLPRMVIPRLAERDPSPPWRQVFIIAWTGMRGVVSLAAALALPLDFPERDLIIFITFCVILATLVLQGLTLPMFIRRLHLKADTEDEEEEITARHAGSVAALAHLAELEATGNAPPDAVKRLRELYEERVMLAINTLTEGDTSSVNTATIEAVTSLHRKVLNVERRAIVQLRDNGVIGDEVMRKIQAQLDLEESRLDEP